MVVASSLVGALSLLAGLDPGSVAWVGAAALVAGWLEALVGEAS